MRVVLSSVVAAACFVLASAGDANGNLRGNEERKLVEPDSGVVGDVQNILNQETASVKANAVSYTYFDLCEPDNTEKPTKFTLVPMVKDEGTNIADKLNAGMCHADEFCKEHPEYNVILDKNCNIKKSNPTSSGDPHFTMWSGAKYDFHGGCDLVLLDNPTFNNNQGLKINIRTKIRSFWSYIEAAVVKIGDETFEVQSGLEDKKFWVNGKRGDKKLAVDSGKLPFTIGGFDVRYRVRRANEFQFKIMLEDKQFILLRSVKDFLRVEIGHPQQKTFSGSNGMMGHYDSGEGRARDGKTLIEDPIKMGMEWQVRSTEPMLFHAAEGVQHPEICAMPSMDLEARRKLREGNISRAAAKKACAGVLERDDMKNCIFDVLATNDLSMAEQYV